MSKTAFEGLIHSAALLIAAAFVYDLLTITVSESAKPVRKDSDRLSAWRAWHDLMLSPWHYVPGIIFDTRSVILRASPVCILVWSRPPLPC
jgi:hypothetical protein